MEAGLRALAELEEEARDLQKKNIAVRRQLRETALERERDKLAASIARKEQKMERLQSAKTMRHNAWQMNQKLRRTEEYRQKIQTEKETKMRRRKALNKQHGGKRNKAACATGPEPSPLLQELSSDKASSLREALLSVSNEEESEELHRIFRSLGNEAGSLTASESSKPGTRVMTRNPPTYPAKMKFKEATMDCSLHWIGGCEETSCMGQISRASSVLIRLDQCMPLGHKALEWLAKGGAQRKHPGTQECLDCGSVFVLTSARVRCFLEERSCIGVATLSLDRAAHLVPCSEHILKELQEAGLPVIESDLLKDPNSVLMIVRTPGATAAPRPATAPAARSTAKRLPVSADATEKLIFQKMLIKLQAGRNPVQLFWEINRAHDGYITFAEFSKEVRQYGVNADDSFVKEVFNSIGSSGTVRKINKSISYKQLLARLRHWQAELYGEKTSYQREYHQKGEGTNTPDSKMLANNLYNPVPQYRGEKRTSHSFSFGGADEYEKKMEKRLEEESAARQRNAELG